MPKRSSWKLPFIHPINYKKFLKSKSIIRLMMRNVLITKSFLNKKVRLYRGNVYKSHNVVKSNLGHKMGEFIFTRPCEPRLHAIKKKKKVLSKKKK